MADFIQIFLVLCAPCLCFVEGELVNVALHKPVKISSIIGGRNASIAVDGDTNAVDPGGVITTDPKCEKDAWWSVDLEQKVHDPIVKIYFRTDHSFYRRRNGVQLYTSSTPFSSHPGGRLCYTVTGEPNGTDISNITTVTNCTGIWRYLLIYTKTSNENSTCPILDFGEVEVLVPGCPDGKFGPDCKSTCGHCGGGDTCDYVTGVCSGGCEPGWTRTHCSDECPDGFFGPDCKSTCGHCGGGQTCDHVTGDCSGVCEPGWTEDKCIQECPDGNFGPDCSSTCGHCGGGHTCDHVTGVCSGGCEPGWSDNKCLQECSHGMFGLDCSSTCGHCGGGQTCNHVTGDCSAGCEPGWTGTHCSDECSHGNFGHDCKSTCGHCGGGQTCNHVTGVCSGGCEPGWSGTHCSDGCPDGNFGPDCSSTCGHCGGGQTCNHVTGVCSAGCEPGWTGTHCSDECPDGNFGHDCSSTCGHCGGGQTCDHVTGDCSGGCEPGWMGSHCIDVCPNGTYGDDCIGNCTVRKCDDPASTCPHQDGSCGGKCSPGYMNITCTQECTAGRYGQNCSLQCKNRNCVTPPYDCNHVTGTCDSQCKAGWTGSDCIEECLNGYYGMGCSKSCSARNCKDTQKCDKITGNCTTGCLAGWTGDECIIRCPNGTYGQGCNFNCSSRHCMMSSDECNHETGACSTHCVAGWNGTDCTQDCRQGYYGMGCSKLCSARNCKENNSCDKVTGNCTTGCKAGWTGDECITSCEGRSYGDGCSLTCEHCQKTCNHTTGLCSTEGCEAGYNGTMCTQKLVAASKPASKVPLIAGGIGTVVVIIVVVIVVIVIMRKRRSSDSKPPRSANRPPVIGSEDPDSNTPKRNEGPMYVNVAMVDMTKKPPERAPKPAVMPKPSVKVQVTKPESQIEAVEEVLEGEEVITNDYTDYKVTRKVKVKDLESAIKRIKSHRGGFEAEYSHLPNGFSAPYDDSQKTENNGKNRFIGYYPYDHNRVRLTPLPNAPGSDYINASTMESCNKEKTYIAAQAPNPKTVSDFWRMIWEHRCERIVMLTGVVEGGKVKCTQYWSKDANDLNTEQYKVHIELIDERANYTIRHFKVTPKKGGKSRSFVQYHYTSWPDHGVPDTLALVNFIWMVRQGDAKTKTPMLVHCSAGIGRTGTYIAVDSLLDQAREEGVVDVMGYVSVMRSQRKNMIQTKEQYECVFKCLLEMTKFGNTSMDVENFTTSYSSRGMDSMVDRKTLREITQMTLTEERKGNPVKHRMWVDGNQDFMVRVGPTLTRLTGYLQAEAPEARQDKLLWKLVEQNDVKNVVLLSPLKKPFHGEKGSSVIIGTFSIKTTDVTCLSAGLTMISLDVKMSNRTQNITTFTMEEKASLDSIASCIKGNDVVHQLATNTHATVLVHSNTERKNAAFFCIMANIASEMMTDGRVDVIGHVRTFLKCSPGMTISEKDVEKMFCFAKDLSNSSADPGSVYVNL